MQEIYWGKASWKLADANISPKSQKSLRLNLPDFLFLEQNELCMNFGEILDRFNQSKVFLEKPWTDSNSFGFPFSKLFVYDVS